MNFLILIFWLFLYATLAVVFASCIVFASCLKKHLWPIQTVDPRHTMQVTFPECVSKVCFHSPDSTSQTRMVLAPGGSNS